MLKKQKQSFWNIVCKLQKPIVFLCLGGFIAVLVYALVFYTPFNDFFTSCNAPWTIGKSASAWEELGINRDLIPEAARLYNQSKSTVIGIDMTYYARVLGSSKTYGIESIQIFNHLLFSIGIIGILATWVLFIYRDQIRKNYYITNYVVNGLWFVFAVSMSLTLFANISYWHNEVLSMDIDMINKFRANLQNPLPAFNLNTLSPIFYVGYAIAGVILLSAICLVLLSVSKFIVTSRRAKEKAQAKEVANVELAKEGE